MKRLECAQIGVGYRVLNCTWWDWGDWTGIVIAFADAQKHKDEFSPPLFLVRAVSMRLAGSGAYRFFATWWIIIIIDNLNEQLIFLIEDCSLQFLLYFPKIAQSVLTYVSQDKNEHSDSYDPPQEQIDHLECASHDCSPWFCFLYVITLLEKSNLCEEVYQAKYGDHSKKDKLRDDRAAPHSNAIGLEMSKKAP